MQHVNKNKLYVSVIIPVIFLISILIARNYGGHLLFHSLAEIFSILVALMMIVIVSFTYQFTKNNFLSYLGIGYFWVALLDLFHMLTYSGMSIYQISGPNTMLTFWLSARLLESFILISALFVSFTTITRFQVFVIFGLIFCAIYSLSFSPYVPILFEQGSGLTSLKINLEYTVIAILLMTILLYIKKKTHFDKSVYYYILASIILTILTELMLTMYASVDDIFTVIAHLLKFLSYWMIFLSMIKSSLEEPFKFLAHESDTYNSIPFPSILVDSKGIIRQINDSTISFLKLEEKNIINQRNHQLFHNPNIEENQCPICISIKNGRTLPLNSIQREDLTYSCSVNPIIIKGITVGSAQVCIDISEQVKKNTELKKSEERFRGLFENSEISIWNEDLSEVIKSLEILREEGVVDLYSYLNHNKHIASKIAEKVKVVDVNTATLRLFNCNSKEELILSINKTFGDNAMEVFIKELDAIWRKEKSFTKEALFKTLDNRLIHGIVTFQIPKELESFSNVSVSIIDISVLKNTEQELQTSNAKLKDKTKELETIIQEAPNPIMIHNEEGKVILVNKVWEELSGYLYHEINTITKWTKKAYGKEMPVVKEYIDTLYSLKHKTDEGEYEIITKSGDINIWQFSSSPLGIIDGKRTVISSAMDITELKNKDKLLYEQTKLASMGEMIGNIAHQWRQPLSIITMGATGMKIQKEMGELSDENFNKNCDAINNNAQYLSKTIDDFRNFIIGDRTKKIFNLKRDIDSFLHLVEGTIKNHEITIVQDIQKDININGYENELIQCFINIFNNSKDAFSEQNPSLDSKIIFISSSIEKETVTIKLKDNAGGIPENILEKVFDPYFTTKDKNQGTGLGLHMTYKIIVEGMNGIIKANNVHYKYNNKNYVGAEFTIILPSTS